MATKKEDEKERELLEAQNLAGWHACLAIDQAMQSADPGAFTSALMKAAFNAGKAIAHYRARCS